MLTTPASIAAGYGAECAAARRLPTPERLAYLRSLTAEERNREIFTRPNRRRRY